MLSEDNLEYLREHKQGYLLGVKRRRNARLDRWLTTLDETQWLACPLGVAAREQKHPPRTRVQEVASGEAGQRVFVIDSEERQQYEQAMRERAMTKTRAELERLQQRVAKGRLVDPARIGAAAAKILQRRHGGRYYDWRLREGAFEFFEHPVHLEREKRLEGKYVLITSEADLTAPEAVARYKELMEVERGFRHLKDVLAMRPIYHRCEPRIRAHIFVATLALLLERLLERRLREAGVDLSAPAALEAVSTIRLVTFHLEGRPPRRGVSVGSAHAQRVLKALGIANAKPPEAPPGEETVM
jgi:transposase